MQNRQRQGQTILEQELLEKYQWQTIIKKGLGNSKVMKMLF